MNELNKKSESKYTNTQVDTSITKRIILVAFGIIEVLLGARFIFKLAGANPENTLINMLYRITNPMVVLFESIFSSATNDGLETTSVFEPGTLIAMIVLALIMFAFFKLFNQNTHVQKNVKEYNTVDQSTVGREQQDVDHSTVADDDNNRTV